ncbi:CHC2 zinc finger domain-containing protein [uncultured Clostridium sp.]|uniref:CHC2 zinc finger domain-containing protein n=1 Tax=uncultured Clostridium sp. TaxID=59620 RepID=UPI0026F3D7A1|nr:CHC2 zinc finger domain-containing protein [uncultured Clostridium sp.]
MNNQVNKENLAKVLNYIRNDKSIYTFEKFFQDNNLLEGSLDNGNEIKIKCPFHEDETPSLGVNKYKKIYNCFSCGRGGDYVNFLKEYKREIEGYSINYYKVVDNILKSDAIMRAILGINSIYITNSTPSTFNNFKVRKPNLVKDKKYEPTTFLELSKAISKLNLTEDQILEAVYQSQLGLPALDIWKNLNGIKINRVDIESEDLRKLTDEDLAMFDLTKILES